MIREATKADLERVAEIKLSNWADTYSALIAPAVLRWHLDRKKQLAELRASFSRADTVLLVAQDRSATVTGFALTYLEEEPEPWLESLHVLREFRSAGVGALLMRATAAYIKAAGYRSMRLGVVGGNSGASRFYERLGGVMIAREPASWAEGLWHDIYRWPDLAALTDQRR